MGVGVVACSLINNNIINIVIMTNIDVIPIQATVPVTLSALIDPSLITPSALHTP